MTKIVTCPVKKIGLQLAGVLLLSTSVIAQDSDGFPLTKPTREKQPNILLILTNDQGWATLGCYGGKIVPTPHLDRLAAEGCSVYGCVRNVSMHSNTRDVAHGPIHSSAWLVACVELVRLPARE